MNVIVRLWTTRLAEGREDDFLRFAQTRSRAMFLSQPGCLGVLFLRAENGAHAACSFWRNSADVVALATSASYRDTVSALVATGVLRGETSTVVYEVQGGCFDAERLTNAMAGLEAVDIHRA
jgi:heme-degrading monooxygenase HmoA